MDVYSSILEGINAKGNLAVTPDVHLQSLKPHVRFLRKAYFGRPVIVPYEKKAIQEAYLITYFPHYYQLIYKIFLEEVPDFFKGKKSVSVSFIGGGPGSEIYGLVRYIANNAKHIKQIKINLFDLNAITWRHSHEIIDYGLLKKTLSADVELIWNSYPLDITNKESVFGYEKQLAASDLVLIQNCLNEIAPDLVSQTNKNVVQIFEWLHPKALLLLADMTSGARDVLKIIEKSIVSAYKPSFHKTTLNHTVSGTMISTHHVPPFQIQKHLLTGEDGLIPRKYVKYDFTILSKKYDGVEPEISALGFGAIYGPLNFAYLDVNDYARSKVFVGVDFGTSTTAVSAVVFNNGVLEIEPLSIPQKGKNGSVKYERLIPGVVSKIGSSLLVGYYAALYRRSLTYGVDTWYAFKTNLGKLDTIRFPNSILKNHSTLKIESLKDALSVYLQYLYREISKLLSEKFPGKEPMYALSVPVDFGSSAKRELKAMMSAAGFNCIDVPFIEEPNAAMVHYFFGTNTSLEEEKPLKALIFDIGAGTVDLSIIEMQKTGKDLTSKLLAVHRDGHQGGNWIDAMIADQMIESNLLLENLPEDRYHSLITYCEELKVLMCKNIVTDRQVGFSLDIMAESDIVISLPEPFVTPAGAKILIGTTYKEFRQIMQTYWNGSARFKGLKSSMQECLIKASLKEGDINKIIITGGGGRNPYVKSYLASYFGVQKLFFVDDIQEQVARGTALHSFVVNSFCKPIITSLLNENYYIEYDGNFNKVFSKGDSYPTHDVDLFFKSNKLATQSVRVFKSEAKDLIKTFLIPEPEKVSQLVFFIDPDQELRCEIITDNESFPGHEIYH